MAITIESAEQFERLVSSPNKERLNESLNIVCNDSVLKIDSSAFGDNTINILGENNDIVVTGNGLCEVNSVKSNNIVAKDNSFVIAGGMSTVLAFDNAFVSAMERADVISLDDAEVVVSDFATVQARGDSRVRGYDMANIEIDDFARAILEDSRDVTNHATHTARASFYENDRAKEATSLEMPHKKLSLVRGDIDHKVEQVAFAR